MNARRAGLFVACLALAAAPVRAAGWQRPLPDTTQGIHVFNDGLATGLSPALVQFAATHYAGTQKMTRADANLLRAVNPGFVILHYRLGMGLGRKTISGPCQAEGGWYQVINGTWEQEWPGDSAVQEPWFHHVNGQRVVQCNWGWFLMDPANASWRSYWSSQVIEELVNNDNDGVFADSFLVPNFMGSWNPGLPVIDLAFEAAWSAKLEGFMTFARQQFAGRWYLIPNVGQWVTSRDITDYSKADGVFIEGFGYDIWENYGLAGWQIQNDRLLPLVQQDRAVIGQSYSNYGPNERMFGLATYLLIKGKQTFVNFEEDTAPEWFPEYEIPVGAPLAAAASSTAALYDSTQGVYRRDYSNGRAIVNPGHVARTVQLGATYYLAQPTGGGSVPWNGVVPATWKVDYTPVTQVTLQPGRGAVLVIDPTPDVSPYTLAVDPLLSGQPSSVRVSGATPARKQYFFVNRIGAGSTFYAPLNVTLSLSQPRLGAIVPADATGQATWSPAFPTSVAGTTLHFQTAEGGHVTNVASQVVH